MINNFVHAKLSNMIIAIDIGGTKTLVATVDQNGQVTNKIKFPSPPTYQEYVPALIDNIKQLTNDKPSIITVGCAGLIDRSAGIIKFSPNLHWDNAPLASDINNIFPDTPVIIENDANLAGLSEANALENINQRVMYITFSTGVGTAFMVNGALEPELLDSEGGHVVFEHDGKMTDWESFAAGKAIVEKYGKQASELDDPVAWREISKNMAIGIVNANAIFMGDVAIIGGGVGTYFEKYGQMLNEEIESLIKISKMVKQPLAVGAKHAEEAVMLGCIINAQQHEQRQQSTTNR